MKRCPKCGDIIHGKRTVCKKCGYILDSSGEDKTPLSSTLKPVDDKSLLTPPFSKDSTKPKKEFNLPFLTPVFMIIIALIVIIAVVSTLMYLELGNKDGIIAGLRNDISVLESELSAVKTEFDGYKTEMTARISAKDTNIAQKASEISGLNRELSTLKSDISALEADIKEWQDKYTDASGKLQITSQELEDATEELTELHDLVSDAYDDLISLFNWVTNNADLPSDILEDVHDDCADPSIGYGSGCYVYTFDLGQGMASCFDYSDDDDRDDDSQFVSSCEDFWDDKEGDCDDYSVFAAAWLRDELERVDYYCSDYELVLQDEATWYCDSLGCDRKYITGVDTEDIFVVCGELKNGDGHCEVGISSGGDPELDDEEYLEDLYLFEPQTGIYQGRASSVFDELHAVINEEDLFYYDDWTLDYSLEDIKSKFKDYGF